MRRLVLVFVAANCMVGCGGSRRSATLLEREMAVRVAEAEARTAEANARLAEAELRQAEAASEGPPDLEGPILDESVLQTMAPGPTSGCYPEGNFYSVRVVEKGEGSGPEYYFMRDENGIDNKYYINQDIDESTRN